MQTLKRIPAVLIFSAIAYLGVACERTATPTGARSRVHAVLLSSDPTTRWVNAVDPNGFPYSPPGTSCDNPGYQTIQDAVTAAGTGDRINVCPGTYMERVTIGAGKDGIQLRSVGRWQAVIKAPPDNPLDPIKAIVRVTGAQNVTILAFTITGPGSGPCNSLRYGVRVDEGGSADILGNHITQIRDEPFSGCQNGVAVLVGRQAEMTTGSARIMGNVIDNYQKNGPTVDNTDSHADIVNNRILGVGPTAVIAQNGIQVSRGATANVRHNFVAENIYAPGTVEATGILLFQSGNVLTEHNSVTSNDGGIFMQEAASGSMTPYNLVRASTFDGITLFVASADQVAYNKAGQNGGPGIGVYDSNNNTLQHNVVDSNQDSGILLDDATDNTVSSNEVMNNGNGDADLTDGIRVTITSMRNTIQSNQLRNNVTHDCHDFSTGLGTLGTANSWVDNHGGTSVPAGLCSGGADDASFQTSTVFGWDPAFPWYDGLDLGGDYDWATAYATIDTDGLLQLLPAIRLSGIRRATPSPNE
jgi:parallel beta-helix repeat protein